MSCLPGFSPNKLATGESSSSCRCVCWPMPPRWSFRLAGAPLAPRRILGAVEHDDRNLAGRQRLLLFEIRDHLLEMLALVRAGGSGADLELIGTHLDRRDRP